MTNAWNLDDEDGSVAIIYVWDYDKSVSRVVRVDVADLEIVNSHSGMWFASKAKSKKDKWYVLGKSHNKTVMLHRLIMGVEDPEIEIHHRDNDGLNNRRNNLRTCTHRENMRFQRPDRDWDKFDREVWLAAQYRAERALAKEVGEEFGLTRQGLWKIRSGKTRSSAAALEYHRMAVEKGVLRFEMLKMKSPKEGKFGICTGGNNR